MNYELIRNFVTVANTLNITRSSEILFVSQSTVSHRLQLLETALGHPLVYRGRGKRLATLTEQGRTFLPIAEKWLSLWRETEMFRSDLPMEHLRIACVSSLATCLISDFVVEFSVHHPNMRLTFQILSSDEIYQLMSRDQLDIGIVLNHVPHQSLQSRVLLSEKMYCVCTDGICPNDKTIATAMLDPAKEIFLNWGVEFSLWHDYRFPDGSTPLLSVNSMEIISSAMGKYDAWSIVPQTVAEYFTERGICHRVSLKNPPPNRVSHVLTSAMPVPATAALIDVFVEELDSYVSSTVKHSN